MGTHQRPEGAEGKVNGGKGSRGKEEMEGRNFRELVCGDLQFPKEDLVIKIISSKSKPTGRRLTEFSEHSQQGSRA